MTLKENKSSPKKKWVSRKSKEKVLPSVTHFPSPTKEQIHPLNKSAKIELIASHFKQIIEILGLDLSHPSLKDTPERVAKMYINEVFSGLDHNSFPEISFFPDEFHHEHHPHQILVKVTFTSFCEHHFVPMEGVAYVAYIPNQKLIGLSKIPRIVRYFARRPQLQERMTAQIADCLAMLLETEDVAVSINARHFCVIARGIEDPHSHTVTNVLRGQFETNDAIRREFFEGIHREDS